MYFLLGVLILLDLLRFAVSFALGEGVVNWHIGNGFLVITKPCKNYGLNRGQFKNFTLYTWNSFTHYLLVSRQCKLLTRALAAALGSSVGCTVDWRQGGLGAILSTSVVFSGNCMASCRDADGLVVTCGMAAFFMCILFLILTHFAVLNTHKREVSVLDRASPWMDHSLVLGSCYITMDCVDRSWGSSFVCTLYLL